MGFDGAERHMERVGDLLMGPAVADGEAQDPLLFGLQGANGIVGKRRFFGDFEPRAGIGIGFDIDFIQRDGGGIVEPARKSPPSVDQAAPGDHRDEGGFGRYIRIEARRGFPEFDEDFLDGIFGFGRVGEESPCEGPDEPAVLLDAIANGGHVAFRDALENRR